MRFQLVSKRSPNNIKYLKRYIKKLTPIANSHNYYEFFTIKRNNKRKYFVDFNYVSIYSGDIIACLQQFALDLSSYCGLYFELDGKDTLWINDSECTSCDYHLSKKYL